jgi:hypothetical protein
MPSASPVSCGKGCGSPYAAGPGDRLVDPRTRTPTQLCYEWAVDSPDTGTELYERLLMLRAMDACRSAASPASYTALRKLFIERPVLTRGELALLNGEPDLLPVIDLIAEAYRPAPRGSVSHGSFAACSRCRCLLTPADEGTWWCEQDRCRGEGHATAGALYPAESAVLRLARPLRLFVTGPGRADIELERDLTRLRLRVEMWPEYDAYDLRVHLPDGVIWAVDVKDRANPALLGKSARPFRRNPPFDAAFLVVPHYRTENRRDYRQVFAHHCPAETASVVALRTDRELVTEARRAVRSGRSSSAPRITGERGNTWDFRCSCLSGLL